MTHGIYLVSGKRRYRGHEPGAEFIARLDPGMEMRAIARGDLRLLERIVPSIEGCEYELPPGWLQPISTSPPEPAKAGFFIEGGK